MCAPVVSVSVTPSSGEAPQLSVVHLVPDRWFRKHQAASIDWTSASLMLELLSLADYKDEALTLYDEIKDGSTLNEVRQCSVFA